MTTEISNEVNIFPCGCSRLKIKLGRCDIYDNHGQLRDLSMKAEHTNCATCAGTQYIQNAIVLMRDAHTHRPVRVRVPRAACPDCNPIANPREQAMKAEHFERARQLINEGWRSTSNAYCHLAKLPEGTTGIECLTWAASRDMGGPKETRKWAERLGEDGAASQFLRVYAIYYGDRADEMRLTLDAATFRAFKKLGGRAW